MSNPNERLNPLSYTIEVFPRGNEPEPAVLELYAQSNRVMRTGLEKNKIAWDEHIQGSKTAITQAAEASDGDTAIILGLGNSMEIPLEDLARRFNQLTVVEIDREAAELAVGKLSPDLQKRVRIRVEDISGGVKNLSDNIANAVESARSAGQIVPNMVQALEHSQIEQYSLDEQYSFVCSSLIGTQLVGLPYEYYNALVLAKFGGRINQADRNHLPVQIALSKITRRLLHEHVQLIRTTMKPGGVGYISDTISDVTSARQPRDPKIYSISQPRYMVDAEYIREISQAFDITAENSWNWHRQPPPVAVSAPTTGSYMQVLAMQLRAK